MVERRQPITPGEECGIPQATDPMSTPDWLKAAADPAEAAAQLHSRLLVAREIGVVYGPGVSPDWVKAAQLPAVPVPEPAKAVADAGVGVMDKADSLVRKGLEPLAKSTGLSDALPPSKSNPGDPLGALGSSIRPGLIGAGVGAGMGLLGGLTGKKKRPISGLLYGGLMGGLAGGAGGLLYDRFAGAPPADKPVPDQVAEAHGNSQSNAPGVVNNLVAGVKGPDTWQPEQLKKLTQDASVNAAIGAGSGAAGGYLLGRGLQTNENRGILNTPAKKTTSTVTGTTAATPPPGWPKGAPPPTTPTKTTTTTIESPTVPRTPHQRGKGMALRGAGIGGLAGPAVSLYNHVHDSGAHNLDSQDPAQAAAEIGRMTAYSGTVPAAQGPNAAAIQAERQKLLQVAADTKAMLEAKAQAGQPRDASDRQAVKNLATELDRLRLIRIQPPAAPARR